MDIKKIALGIRDLIQSNNKQIKHADERMSADFLSAFKAGYISDKYQLLIENEYLEEALKAVSSETLGTYNLELLIEQATSQLLRQRRIRKEHEELWRLGVTEAMIKLKDLMRYGIKTP